MVPEETALATLAGLRSLRPTGRNPLLALIHDACAPRTCDLGYGVLTKGQFTVTGNTLRIELKTSPRLDHTPKHMILAAGFIQNARRHRFRNRTVVQCARQHTPVRASLSDQGPLPNHSPSKEGSLFGSISPTSAEHWPFSDPICIRRHSLVSKPTVPPQENAPSCTKNRSTRGSSRFRSE